MANMLLNKVDAENLNFTFYFYLNFSFPPVSPSSFILFLKMSYSKHKFANPDLNLLWRLRL